MPLHLLPKKSWHVYNSANIARVRADEAAAAAEEERREQRMQENDAARRLAILRGETPPPLEDEPEVGAIDWRRDDAGVGDARRVEKRKRKRRGEDDTDFEMRVARERAEVAGQARSSMGELRAGDAPRSRKEGEAEVSIVDERGHIDLFGPAADPSARPRARDQGRGEKNADAEREKAEERAKQDVTMRFVDAAGRGGEGLKGQGPWYSKHGCGANGSEVEDDRGPRTDAFGRPDEGRKGREEARIVSNDPLAMMKRGAKKVREVEAGRKKEREEREEELRALRKEERREERRRRRDGRDADDRDSLDGFSLDAPSRSDRPRSRDRKDRHRSRSREHRHRHSHRRHDDDERRHHRRNRDEKKHEGRRRSPHRRRSRERSPRREAKHAG